MATRKGSGDSVDASRGVDPTRAIDAADAVGALEGVEATTRTDRVQGVGPVRQNDAIAAVAAALRAGEITVAQAVDKLIDDALGKQVGRAIEPGSDVEAKLRQALHDYADADPLISAKIRRLEGRRPAK